MKLEKYMAGASILDVIIIKLCHEKMPYPIILFKVDKSLEIGFHHIFLLLSFAVYL